MKHHSSITTSAWTAHTSAIHSGATNKVLDGAEQAAPLKPNEQPVSMCTSSP